MRLKGSLISVSAKWGKVQFLPLAVFWCLLTCSPLAFDASARPRFDAWTTDNGLPQNSVPAILQTRDGYLWLATLGGLVRYDGVRFTVFDKATHRASRATASSHFSRSRGRFVDRHRDSGLIRYREGTFTAYTTRDGLPGTGWSD